MFAWTIGLFLVIEPITGQFIEPLLYGRSMGLSPVAVVVSAVFWTWLWGPVGLFLARPLTMCLVVLGCHFEHLQFLDVLLGDRPALTPAESFYQRMLAGDPDEAVHQAEEFLKDKALPDYYDDVAIKGLALAQLDVNRGMLDHGRQVQIKEAVDDVIDALSDAPSAPERPGPAAVRPAVLCIAGRGALDEAAAAMLAQLIQKHGIAAHIVPKREGPLANIFRVGSADVKLVCLSYVESGGFTNTRVVIKRLRRKWPRAKILLGLWTKDQIEVEGRRALQRTEADLVVTSLRQAIEQVVAEMRDAGDSAPYDTLMQRPARETTPRKHDPETG
ncbi:MAG: AI-2E family transporter [Rhizomicrobium sp.]